MHTYIILMRDVTTEVLLCIYHLASRQSPGNNILEKNQSIRSRKRKNNDSIVLVYSIMQGIFS